MPQGGFEHSKGVMVFILSLVLLAAVLTGVTAGYSVSPDNRYSALLMLALVPFVVLASFVLYRKIIFPYYRRLEDANLELHLKHEELLDIKDDLFIKFLGVYDLNYAANSPRLFADRLKDVADTTARVMEADACFIYFYDRQKDVLLLAPGPINRGVEISSHVADGDQSHILKQVENGVAVRMAMLYHVSGGELPTE
jgi:hypothetical protein